ncbi:MAG: hypothetical protein E2O54_02325 [Gammaproteobacteria bacterium]|nr:MAG: hypothetical protein E2O54_02325 [Gammaproteobacteria bacterium]
MDRTQQRRVPARPSAPGARLMSYILEAIKKSEAERNLGVSPGALASSTPVSGTTTPVRIATAIIILNVAALGGWWWWQLGTPATLEAADAALPASISEGPSPPSDAVYPRRPVSQRIEQAPVLPPPEPPARLPEFSSHVFADDPQLRAVTLDGRRLTEGDLISPGMRLLEITENGVVLDVDGKRIVFDVLQDWRS